MVSQQLPKRVKMADNRNKAPIASKMSKSYYFLKGGQAILTLMLLLQIFGTKELCGDFIQKQWLIDEAINYCPSVSLLLNTVNPGFLQSTTHPVSTLHQFDDALFPRPRRVSDDSLCIRSNDTLTSSFKRSLRVAMNPFEEVADKFALPILFSIIYLILLAMHTALQIPPKYNAAEYAVVLFSAVTWTLTYVGMAVLFTNWNSYWLCSNFRPHPPMVTSTALLISATLVILCLVEILYNRELMDGGAKRAAPPKKQQQQPPQKQQQPSKPVQGPNNGGGGGNNNQQKRQPEVITVIARSLSNAATLAQPISPPPPYRV